MSPEARERANQTAPVSAPTLPVGRAWTYKALQAYDPATELTIVVMGASDEGYLFGAGSQTQTVYPLLWGSEFYGPHARNLTQLMGGKPGQAMLSFPLYEGKTWVYYHQNMTAHAANVTSPTGTEYGYRIVNDRADFVVQYEYAPSVGYVTSYRWGPKDHPTDELKLTRVQENQKGVWGNLGKELFQDDRTPPLASGAPALPVGVATLDVPPGFDALLISAGASAGRVSVRGPDGSAWDFAHEGAEVWQNAMLPGAAGKWSALATNETKPGFAFVALAPVKWS